MTDDTHSISVERFGALSAWRPSVVPPDRVLDVVLGTRSDPKVEAHR